MQRSAFRTRSAMTTATYPPMRAPVSAEPWLGIVGRSLKNSDGPRNTSMLSFAPITPPSSPIDPIMRVDSVSRLRRLASW